MRIIIILAGKGGEGTVKMILILILAGGGTVRMRIILAGGGTVRMRIIIISPNFHQILIKSSLNPHLIFT
jgi:hypothetical protein